MISSGRLDFTTASSTGSIACRPRQLLLVQQHVDVLELGRHLLGIGDEIGRQIAAIELHALDDIDLGLERLVLLDGDDAFIADFLHRLRDHLADRGVAVRRDGADLGHLGRRGDRLGALLEVPDHGTHRDLDAALQVHRIHPGGDRLGALPHDGLPEHGGGGGAVACGVAGLGSDLAQHLRAHVLELVVEFDLLGDGDAVLGDTGGAEALFDEDMAALGAERHLDRVGENVDAAQQAVARVAGKPDVLGCHFVLLEWVLIPSRGPLRASRGMRSRNEDASVRPARP
jgi:hypothetical protein